MSSEEEPVVKIHSSWVIMRRWMIALITIGILVGSANAGFTLWQVRHSQQNWCQVLDLLTAVPVHAPTSPKASPSRAAQYQLYTDFVMLKRDFGCDPS